MPGKYDPDKKRVKSGIYVKKPLVPFQPMTDEEWWESKRYKRLHNEAVRRNYEYHRQRIMEKDEKPDSLS